MHDIGSGKRHAHSTCPLSSVWCLLAVYLAVTWLLALLLQTGFFNDQIGPVVVAVLIMSSLIFIAAMAFHDMLTR